MNEFLESCLLQTLISNRTEPNRVETLDLGECFCLLTSDVPMSVAGAVDGADMRPPLPELRPLLHHPANQLGGVRPDHVQQGQRFRLLRIQKEAC